jgi:D-sedoheptulose 7-phosphate isomerase
MGVEHQNASPPPTDLNGDPRGAALDQHLRQVSTALQAVQSASMHAAVDRIRRARHDRKHIFVFGNGGSAATALHLANDLTMLRAANHAPLRVTCLNANVSLLTAIANDYGYEHIFSKQLSALVSTGDLVIGISGSGRSQNCLEAFRCARERGVVCVGLLGSDGGPMLEHCDVAVHVPASDCLVSEDVHIVLAHSITRMLEAG